MPPNLPWLISGATSGIGLALARLCQGLGVRTILLGRKPLAELPQELFGEENYLQADLGLPTAPAEVTQWLDQRGFVKLQGVVHNAAIGWVGELTEQSADSIQAALRINVLAPILLTNALAARCSRVVFISSVIAELGAANYGVYAATKAAMNAFTRSLRAEQPPYFVQTLHLGAVRTEFHQKCGWEVPAAMAKKFAAPEATAAWVWRQLQKHTAETTMGFTNRFIKWYGGLMKFPCARRQTPTPTKHVLITGAAQGIGKALVAAFRSRGCLVTGIDVQASDPEMLCLDLADPSSWEPHWPTLGKLPPIDLVIHNAGINATGAFTKLAPSAQERVWAVNFLAPLCYNASLFQHSLTHAATGFIFISSLSSFTGYPGASVYGATKAGLAAYARSLRQSRRVLTVFPGPVRTAHAQEHSPDNRYEHKRMPPAVLAEAIGTAWQRGSTILLPGFGPKLSALLGWMFPKTMTAVMRRILFAKMP